MAVPKKRTGHSAQGSRRANWKATKPTTAKCPKCGATVLAHTVCTECGTYKGEPVRLADKAAAAEAAKAPKKAPAKKAAAKKTSEEKAPAKKTTKKTSTKAKAEETKTEEKTKTKAVEEAKAEAPAEEETKE